jgi:hypothetical protein
MKPINWPASRQAIIVLGLFALFWFSWASHSRTLFNGLATPLFFALAAYLVVLASQYRIAVKPRSLLIYLLFAAWAVFADSRSGEFLPALAMDSHWFILPLATLLMAQVFGEYPLAFQAIRIGAALCIINLILTMLVNAEWYDNWHWPPIFGHIQHLALSIGFLTILLFAKNEMAGWVAVFFRLSRILGLALVFWSGSRTSLLALVGSMVVFIYCDRRWAKTLLIDSIAAIALSLVPDPPFPKVSGVLPRFLGGERLKSLDQVTVDSLSSLRLTIWQSLLAGLNDIGRLWTGVGGNGTARVQVMHGAVMNLPGRIRHVQAHNVIVQSICDWGLVGLMLLGGFFYQSTLRPIIADRKQNDPTALAGIVYLLVTGMLDATLYHLEHLIYLAIAIAWLVSQKPLRQEKSIIIPTPVAIAFLLGLALIHTQTFDYRIGMNWYFPTQ